MPIQWYVHVKSQCRGKNRFSHSEISVSCTTREYTTTVTAPYYPISSQLSVSGRLREVKNKRKFQTLPLKVVAVAYERWSLTRGFQYSDLAEKRLVF